MSQGFATFGRDPLMSWGVGLFGSVGALVVTIFVPLLVAATLMGKRKKKMKQRGVLVQSEGEEGVTMRHAGSPEPVEVPWEEATTAAALFEQCCQKHSELRLLGSRKLIDREIVQGEDGRKMEKLHLGEYQWKTYAEGFHLVSNFASGLVNLGHNLDSRAAIFSETREEVFIALQGCFRQNVTVVTVHASLGEDALVHSLNETQAATLICDSKQLEKLDAIKSRLISIQNVVYFEDDMTPGGPRVPGGIRSSWRVVSFSEVDKLGKLKPVQPRLPAKNDIAFIMYTSGSTGQPKGVMITHGNIVATIAAILRTVPPNLKSEVYLAYLPMAHVLELICEFVMFTIGGSIGYGSALTLTDTSSKVKKGTQGDASALKPTIMTTVPAIIDRVRDGVMRKVGEKGGIASKLFEIAYKRRLAALEGSWFGAWGLERMFWDAIIFKGIRSILGGQIWYMICGGAPLSKDAHRFVNVCMGAHLNIGYGLTETCGGATFTEWDDETVGRVGPPLPCSYVKLVSWNEGGYSIFDKPMPRGEIVVGGLSTTAGYLYNEEKTKEVYKVDERGVCWFYTGDIGQFHPDGCIEIIDRKKDIVKLQHGEYVSLGKVEAALKTSSYVDNIMVYADPLCSYCIALIVPSCQDLTKWAEGAGIKYKDFSELCEKKEAVNEVQQSVLKAAKGAKLGKFEIPAMIGLLPDPWTPESGLVTGALKIKREQLKVKFKDELQKLYG